MVMHSPKAVSSQVFHSKYKPKISFPNDIIFFRTKEKGPFGKSCCWKCGRRDIWKRKCGTCFSKYCTDCMHPGPLLDKCELCDLVLSRKSEPKSWSFVEVFKVSVRNRFARSAPSRLPSKPSQKRSVSMEQLHSVHRKVSLIDMALTRRVMCESGNADSA